MPLPPWHKVATPRVEVRAGRSFNPDEFVIHLEQVVGGDAPPDYANPAQFFARTSFTRALRSHATMVLRRLSGQTANTAPVLTLVTQFGGGKTHTLAALYHLATGGDAAAGSADVAGLLRDAGLSAAPGAQVAAFVGNAWDPQDGRETPWIDLARQIAGEEGVKLLGKDAINTPPGTEALARVFAATDAPVLVLFDEVLNFCNRHRNLAEPFYAFIQNLTGAMTAGTHRAAVISLPQSAVEMTEFDMAWQDRIAKVVKRVAKDLIANDEAEISEVVRRRLFDDLGDEKTRHSVAKKYADWCFANREALPPEWTVGAGSERLAKQQLRARFAACYPFHPATLSVFQRKWRALPQFQQTRATLAMLGQWISWAYNDDSEVHAEPLLTVGSAPLSLPDFRGAVLGQLGEGRLQAAIDADIAGERAHTNALDADTKGALRGIHKRVATAILFESSGGQVEKIAHLPELRFALGGPGMDTASIDNAAAKLESRAYFLRKVGADGFKVSYKPTLRKVVYDRRAALDEEREIVPAMRELVRKQFGAKRRGDAMQRIFFPVAGEDVPDSMKLVLVVLAPDLEWGEALRAQLAAWTKRRGNSPRLYPGALVWVTKKPGRELRESVELWLAWKRVELEVANGTLGDEFERDDRNELRRRRQDAEQVAEESVWSDYRYIALYDAAADGDLKEIDLGVGHSSAPALGERIISELKTNDLLNDSVAVGYLERNWPHAFASSAAWPLSSLRQSFLNGALTRLVDPDVVLRDKIVSFVRAGDFGLASRATADGGYAAVWYKRAVDPAEVAFEADVYLLQKARAAALTGEGGGGAAGASKQAGLDGLDGGYRPTRADGGGELRDKVRSGAGYRKTSAAGGATADKASAGKPVQQRIFVEGEVPSELWNRVGTTILPKLRGGNELTVNISLQATVDGVQAEHLREELMRLAEELGGGLKVEVEK